MNTNLITRIYLTAVWSILTLTITAQQPLSLSDAITRGLRNNYQIEIADLNTSIAENNNNWEQAGRYPTVSLNLAANNGFTARNDPSIVFNPQNSFFLSNVSASVDASWVLFDGFQARINKQQLEQLEAQGRGNAAVVIENTIQSIILAYYQAQLQQEQLLVLEEVLELSRDRVEYQKIRQEYGQATTFDLLQTQDAYLNDSTNYLVQQNNYRSAIRNLNLAMRIEDLNTNYQLTDALEYEAQAYELEDLRARMIANNNTLENLRINRELANINRELQEANRLPQVRLNSGLAYGLNPRDNGSAINPFTQEKIGFTVGRSFNSYLNLSATYPIYDGGVRKRNVENAQIREVISQLNIEDQKQVLSNQLENIYDTYLNQLELVQLTEELLENARRNLAIAEERFRGGLISSFDYRTIQLGYINASQARLSAVFNLKATETDLIRLIGGLVR